MTYFLDQKKKYQHGEKSKYNIQDDSDERVFKQDAESKEKTGEALSEDAFAAQKRLNDKWAGTS